MNHQNGSSDKRTVVDEGTSFKGSLSSSCPIDVRGRIEGDLETPSLTISHTGAVHGRVKVGSVRSEGEIAGEFEADHVELAGSVKDNTVIRARSLEVRLATERGRLQVIFGECELSVGDEPTEHVELPVEAEQALLHAEAPVETEQALIAAAAPVEAAGEMPADAPVEMSTDAMPPPAGPSIGEEIANAAAREELTELDEAGEDEDEDDISAAPVEAVGRKQRHRRKGKNGPAANDPPLTGWSQPPSQAPPAS
ncbi:MAG TPA: polymer-forming cytoskeletal protein [Polyangiaceae bacterium]|nr:polymer-forming cytoskeletal protein [Polyangiaceae bacterium]